MASTKRSCSVLPSMAYDLFNGLFSDLCVMRGGACSCAAINVDRVIIIVNQINMNLKIHTSGFVAPAWGTRTVENFFHEYYRCGESNLEPIMLVMPHQNNHSCLAHSLLRTSLPEDPSRWSRWRLRRNRACYCLSGGIDSWDQACNVYLDACADLWA
jgi:hypothetical protein